MQMKKNRGFRSPHPRKTAVSLDTLDRSYADGETVSVQSLQEKGILTKKNAAFGAKVLSTGKLSKKLTIAPEIRVSAGAKTAIENAGGRIEEVPQEETASNQ
jgi:ribosomal protein L15